MPDDTQPAVEAPKRRWPGVLLSLFVPGFGLARAGLFRRAVLWFVAVQIIGVLVVLLAIWRSIPVWAFLAGLTFAVGCQLSMLVDSFRPGRLSARLWIAFVALLLAIIFAPSVPHLFAHAFTVPTDGMAPTLLGRSHGTADHVITDRFSYRFSPPKRGELVVFRTTGIAEIRADTFFVQRLVGLPGEKIEIRDGHIFADGRQLGESDGIPGIAYTTAPARPF
jgi:signal peptidase I